MRSTRTGWAWLPILVYIFVNSPTIYGQCLGTYVPEAAARAPIARLTPTETQLRIFQKIYALYLEHRALEADARNAVLKVGDRFPGSSFTVKSILLLNNIFVEYLVQTPGGTQKVIRLYYDPSHVETYKPLGSFTVEKTDLGVAQISVLERPIPQWIQADLTRESLKNYLIRRPDDIFIFQDRVLTVKHFLGAGGQGQVYIVTDGLQQFTLKVFYEPGEAERSAAGLKNAARSVNILAVSPNMILMPYTPSLPLEVFQNLQKYRLLPGEISVIENLLPQFSNYISHQNVLEIETGLIRRIDFD